MAKRAFSFPARCMMILEAGVILPFVYFCSFFSFRRIERISCAVGYLILKISPAKKEEVRENLSVIFPGRPYSERELAETAAYGQGYILRVLIELQKMSRMGAQDILSLIRIETPVFPVMRRLSLEKKPQVFLTLHAGNWELLGIMMGLAGFDMLSVVERQFNPVLDNYCQRLRRKAGIRPIYNEISLMRPLLRAMKRGACAALVADQNYWHDPFFLPFFGKEASAPKGAGALVLHSGAFYAYGGSETIAPGRIRVFVQPPKAFVPCGDKEADLMRLISEIYEFYEGVIRSNPKNWFLLSTPRWRLNRETWKKWADNPDSNPF